MTIICGTTYCKERKKWKSQISINGKTKFIGRFDTQKEAHDAYIKKKDEMEPRKIKRD
jgi:hypothetical protein